MRRLFCLLLIAPLCAAQGFDRMLPESVIGYVSVENVARTKERVGASALGRLWKDPAVAKFAEQVRARWTEMMDEMRQEDGFTLEDVLGVVSGQVAVAVTAIEPDVTAVALVDVGENVEKLRALLAKAEETIAATETIRRDEEEFGDTTIVIYRSPHPEGEDEPVVEGCWFLAGSTFAYADVVDDLKRVLTLRGAGEGGLAANEKYQRVRRRLGARADMVAYADAGRLMGLAAEAFGDNGAQFIQAFGLGAVEAIGMQGAIGDDGLRVDTFLPVAGEKEGVLKLFDSPNSALQPPAFVPADALMVSMARLETDVLWEEARKVADRMTENGAEKLDEGIAMVKNATGVDLATDVIGALGEDFIYYLKETDEAAPGLQIGPVAIPRLVLAIHVKDAERLQTALDTLTGLPQVQGWLREEEYLGTKMKTILAPFPGLAPAFTVLPDRFALALQVDDLKELMARHGKDIKGLADHDDYTRVLQHVPQESIAINFSREAKALRQAMVWGALDDLTGKEGALDMTLFPKAEVLEKYIDNSLTVTRNEEDGVSVVYFLKFRPKPAEDE